MPAPAITLLTDFGTADGYVAEMKGVLVTLAPGVPIIDLSHDLPPQDVESARLAVARYWLRFPIGTVHLVVVDPGVGTTRAAVAIESDGRFLVGPDNGALSPALLIPEARVVAIVVPADASATFHGRDVLAPVAAALAVGERLDDVGVTHGAPVVRRTPPTRRISADTIEGEILTIDRFGNAITNLMLRTGLVVHLGARMVEVYGTYGDAPAGVLAALTGSNGFMELVVANQSAAGLYGLQRGQRVRISPRRPSSDQDAAISR